MKVRNILKARTTEYKVNWYYEPCWQVSKNNVMVRIVPYYYIGAPNTLLLREFVNGRCVKVAEHKGDYDSLTESKAKELALEFSARLA